MTTPNKPRESSTTTKAIRVARVKLGRRVYFRTADIAKVLNGS